MNEAEIPIHICTLKLQDWLVSRRIVPKNIQNALKDVRSKISKALQDMPSNDDLIKLLKGSNINYYHCKKIVDILKQTEKDSKSIFGSYGSQRMKDWQEILRLYEKDNLYLAETAQLYVRNVNFEIPAVRKQMTKLEQQSDEALKRSQDLNKPEAQLLAEHAALLQKLGVKGDNLREEFIQALSRLPDLYTKNIEHIDLLQEPLDLYADATDQSKHQCLPIIRHLIEFGNTTVYQYIHKEAPLQVEEPPIELNLSEEHSTKAAEIDFGDDSGGTSSTISGEMIDFGDFSLDNDGKGIDFGDAGESADIDWGIEDTSPADAVEVNFDIPIEEYGIVVKGAGMDGGIARGDQAYTILDSPVYRERYIDELIELSSFCDMRCHELIHGRSAAGNIMFSLMESLSTHDADSIRCMRDNIHGLIQDATCLEMRHLFKLKHSPKYADLMAAKLKKMLKAVEKIRSTKLMLKERAAELRAQRVALNPVLEEIIDQTNELQRKIEQDISKRYKNRVVNLLGGISS